jgi:hypothetical protein
MKAKRQKISNNNEQVENETSTCLNLNNRLVADNASLNNSHLITTPTFNRDFSYSNTNTNNNSSSFSLNCLSSSYVPPNVRLQNDVTSLSPSLESTNNDQVTTASSTSLQTQQPVFHGFETTASAPQQQQQQQQSVNRVHDNFSRLWFDHLRSSENHRRQIRR